MGQYTVAKYLYENGPCTSNEISRQTNDNSASVSQSLTELKKKDVVRQRDDDRWEYRSDAGESRLEAMKPTTISQIREEKD